MAMEINVGMIGKSRRHYWVMSHAFGNEYQCSFRGKDTNFYNQMINVEVWKF